MCMRIYVIFLDTGLWQMYSCGNVEIMFAKKLDWLLIIVILIMVVVTSLPYFYAAIIAGDEYIFGGFLFNPIDGNSYLAKMRQGWEGSWRFSLPYTAEPGNGAFIFLFYLFLGKISRISGLTLLMTFHAARVMGLIMMLVALYYFFKQVLRTDRQLKIAFILSVFGSGLGWAAMFFGVFTADFWVAEAYPFLSAYTNPHFPLGVALLLWLFSLSRSNPVESGVEGYKWNGVGLILGSILLGVVMPFGVVIAILVLGCLGTWRSIELFRSGKFQDLISFTQEYLSTILVGLGGGPILLYYFWVTFTDPMMAGWNSQNLTPSPPIWDFIVSFLPVLIFVIPGALIAVQDRTQSMRILVVWSILGLLLLWIPFGLQRRFMLGLYIPFSGLASLGVDKLLDRLHRNQILILISIIGFALITNFTVIMAGIGGVRSRDKSIYMTQGEAQAFEWMDDNVEKDAIILAGSDTGLLIPAYTGRRVIYGHPFETVNANTKKKEVNSYFINPGGVDSSRLLYTVDYIFVGPREWDLASNRIQIDLQVVYDMKGVTIYSVTK